VKLIYIAGRYRDPRGEFYVLTNILEARRAALFVWLNGGAALCPHSNTAFFGGAFGIQDATWLEGDLEMLRRCDAVWALPGWEGSAGARGEVEEAGRVGVRVLYSQADVVEFLGEAR
jgi:hypothetical protein